MFGLTYADSNNEYDSSNTVILGVPYDSTSSFRTGSRESPAYIRHCSYNFEKIKTKNNIKIHDLGNINNCSTHESMAEEVKFFLKKTTMDKKFHILIGGDHSITLPSIHYLKNFTLISLDAHLDYRETFMGSPYSSACIMKRCEEKIGPENIFILGVRSVSDEEELILEKLNYYTSENIIKNGIKNILNEILDKKKYDPIYLTIDMDVIDPSFAPGVSNPEPYGLAPSDIKTIIKTIGENLIGFDINEICPSYDPSWITSILASKFVNNVIEEINI